MLFIQNLYAGYGPLEVLKDMCLDLEDGKCTGIFGHNGAGKTTLLRSIVGSVVPRSGKLSWSGQELPYGDVPATVKRGIAFVPQGHNVFPTLSVEKNLLIAGSLFGESFLQEVLHLFPVLQERRNQRAGSMSGGEQQMLALGMALMTRPKLLLLDEPSTGLAPVIVRNVMDGLRDVNKRFGTGIIVVEQNVPATLKLVDRAIIIKSGQVVFDGSREDLLAKKDLWEWF
jgi:branched-chain amino acid transport system ATP-binding protein